MAIKISKKTAAKKGTKKSTEQPTGTVETQHPDGSVETQTEAVGDSVVVEEPMCNVGMSAGRTFNLGEFNSLKVQVSLHVPAKFEDIEDAFTFTKEWVDNKLNAITEEVENASEE